MLQGGKRTKAVAAVLIAGGVLTCLATGADARWRRHHGWSERWSAPPEPAPQVESTQGPATQFQPDGRSRRETSRRRDTAFSDTGRRTRGGGAFGAVVEHLIRGCAGQGTALSGWPFEVITRIVAPDTTQAAALDSLRDAAQQASATLVTDCPQAVPAAPAARLEAVEQAIDAAGAAFATVQPVLAGFYATLDDEQKARLLRDLVMRDARPPPEASSRRERWRAYAQDYRARRAVERRSSREREPPRPVASWSRICEDLTVALRGWPIREIERNVRLSEEQRVSFYELVTASLKSADTLASACPADAALTPPARMDIMRKRLAAIRAATAAIRPTLLRFYGALDQGQKLRFAEMS
jgi:hypothetical protein